MAVDGKYKFLKAKKKFNKNFKKPLKNLIQEILNNNNKKLGQ